VNHFAYLAVLGACVLGTLPLELFLRVRVYARWRRVAASVLPVVVCFGGEDLYAISRRLWRYDPHYLIGVTLPGRLPLEELLFFLVVPTCAVLSYEAVLARRPEWRA
jgi:lycopene cyclase domain-containing protein